MNNEIDRGSLDFLSIDELEIQLIQCRKALVLISKIGTKYSGFGASCANIANNALRDSPLSDQAKKTIQLVEDK